MKRICGVVLLGGFVFAGLGGCSDAARETDANTAPLAKDVTLSTSESPAHVGAVLHGGYRYIDVDGDGESGTVTAWLRDGQPIDGANQDNYTVTAQDSGKTLHYRVIPAAASGESPGMAGVSPGILIENRAPRITDLTILSSAANEVYLGVRLSASYRFQDLDGDGEGASTYEWRRNGTAIGGATAQTYTVTSADVGQTLAVQITPKDNVVPAQSGAPVVSDSVTVAPDSAASVVLTVSADLKQLHFSWAPLRSATYYKLSTNPDGVSGFVPLSAGSENLTATTYDWDIPIHRINWVKAQFKLEACASTTCVASASISALDVMVSAIGYFKASNTGSGDYFGVSVALSADGNTLAVGAHGEDSAAIGIGGNQTHSCTTPATNCAVGSGAVYVYTRANGVWSPQPTYIKASNTGVGDFFGRSVSLSADGNTLAVGASGESGAKTGITPGAPNETDAGNGALGAGAVYVFTRSGTAWSQQAYVKASNTGTGDWFGYSTTLSADGNTLAAGAYGEDSATIGVIPGAPSETETGNGAGTTGFSGAVYVFTRSGATWSQQAYVKASNTGSEDFFGYSNALSADGNTLAVGALYEDSAKTGVTPGAPDELATGNGGRDFLDSGAVYIFTRSGVTWSQQNYVKASNTSLDNNFGDSVDLSADGNTLAVGASSEGSAKTGITPGTPNKTETGNDVFISGAVYVFIRSGATWSQQAYVKASNTGADDGFGVSVALSADGNTLAVGAVGEDSERLGVTPGAPDEATTGNGALLSGTVYVFTRSATTWTQQAYVKASNTGGDDYFGNSVALSADGNTLAVGAYGEDSAATGLNNTAPGQGDSSAANAGAVYLY